MKNLNLSKLGLKVKENIKEKGWTITSTAKKANIPLPTMKDIIYGSDKNRKTDTLKKLANIFGCKIEDFIFDDEQASYDQKHSINIEIFKECLDLVYNYCSQHSISLDKNVTIKIIDELSIYLARKRINDHKFIIPKDIIKNLIEINSD